MPRGHWKAEGKLQMNEWMNLWGKKNGNLCTCTGDFAHRTSTMKKKGQKKRSSLRKIKCWVSTLLLSEKIVLWTVWTLPFNDTMDRVRHIPQSVDVRSHLAYKIGFCFECVRKGEWAKSVFVGYFLLESTVEMTSISRPKLYNLLLFNVLLVLSPAQCPTHKERVNGYFTVHALFSYESVCLLYYDT